MRKIPPFDARSGHCNKISALAAAAAETCGVVAFTDCDLVFLSDPRNWLCDPGALHAKPVDKVRMA